MRTCGSRLTVCPVIAALLLAQTPGLATTYHPLDVGTEWHYADELDRTNIRSITGTQEVLGVETVVRNEEIREGSSLVDLVDNFWTATPGGDLYIHGWINHMHGADAAYCPPIKMVDSPLQYDKVWVTLDVQFCDLDGTNCGPPSDIAFIVCFEGEVIVPAGTFHCFGIGDYPAPPILRFGEGPQFDLLGRRVVASGFGTGFVATDWYCEDVGVVQYQYYTEPERMMRLQSWQPTPVEPDTWGRLKALYR